MKLLSNIEACQISGGGTLRGNGRTIYVDTTGIPNHCASQIEGMVTAVFAQSERSTSATSLFNVMGPHMDRLMNSGCDNYLATYNSRLRTARVV
jgi:hypothetical protein